MDTERSRRPHHPCPRVREAAAYIQSSLDASAAARFESHWANCPDCRAAVERFRSVVARLKAIPPEPARDLSAEIIGRIPASAWTAQSTRMPFTLGWPSLLLRAAAGLLLCGGLWYAWTLLPGTTGSPPVGSTARMPSAKTPVPPAVIPDALGPDTHQAITQGLAWLRSTQEDDGHWDPAKWGAPRPYAVGITALATMAIGIHREVADDGWPAESLRRGLAYLAQQQAPDGRIGPDCSGMPYNHALATLAFLRARPEDRTTEWTNRCRRAIDVIRTTQQPAGGWGYAGGPENPANTSITVWQLQALLAADAGGFPDLDRSIQRGVAWLTDTVNHEGWMGYTQPVHVSQGAETMTAAGLLCLLTAGPGATRDDTTRRMLNVLVRSEQQDHRPPDYYRAYFVVQALDQAPGPEAAQLAAHIRQRVRNRQNTAGPAAGSWSPDDRWGSAGGRVYATAVSLLALNDRR